MRQAKSDYSWIDRMMVVAILLTVTLFVARNLIQAVNYSEQRAVNSAVVDYTAVRNMYSENSIAVSPASIQASGANVEMLQDAPVK